MDVTTQHGYRGGAGWRGRVDHGRTDGGGAARSEDALPPLGPGFHSMRASPVYVGFYDVLRFNFRIVKH
jgi:hypothetical protein